jgi:hypothetical protein
MGHLRKACLTLAAMSAAAFSLASAAEAGRCKGHDCRHGPYAREPGVYRYVYAESNYSDKHLVAPVRAMPLGDQVRLPGGAWVYCENSCEYTLRRTTLDFWEDQTQKWTSPNYFRFDLDLTTGRVYRRYQ